MTTANVTTSLIIQQPRPATTPPATTSQNPTSSRDVQDAAHDLREAIRNNIQREIDAAAQQAGRRAAAGPTPPPGPRQITIRRPDGNTVISVPPFGDNAIPPQVVDISIAFFLTMAAIIIGLPLARAFARRIDRRGGTATIPHEIASQLTNINQAVDAIALEVERISEGQRFTARLLSEQRDAARQTLPSGVDR